MPKDDDFVISGPSSSITSNVPKPDAIRTWKTIFDKHISLFTEADKLSKSSTLTKLRKKLSKVLEAVSSSHLKQVDKYETDSAKQKQPPPPNKARLNLLKRAKEHAARLLNCADNIQNYTYKDSAQLQKHTANLFEQCQKSAMTPPALSVSLLVCFAKWLSDLCYINSISAQLHHSLDQPGSLPKADSEEEIQRYIYHFDPKESQFASIESKIDGLLRTTGQWRNPFLLKLDGKSFNGINQKQVNDATNIVNQSIEMLNETNKV